MFEILKEVEFLGGKVCKVIILVEAFWKMTYFIRSFRGCYITSLLSLLVFVIKGGFVRWRDSLKGNQVSSVLNTSLKERKQPKTKYTWGIYTKIKYMSPHMIQDIAKQVFLCLSI